MRTLHGKVALLVAASLALSGCHSIFGGKMSRIHGLRVAPTGAPASATAQATEQGRHELDQGQIGLAIESFQRALASGEPPAPALNGLGVAYAQLGRFETAHRFFSEAMAIEPTDERFAANLARLTRSPAFAMRHDGDAGAALERSAQAEQAAAVAQAPSPLQHADAQRGLLTRVSSHEFRIQTVAPLSAPLRAAHNTAGAGFRPIVRIEFGAPAKAATAPKDNISALSPPGGTAKTIRPGGPVIRMLLPQAKPLSEAGPANPGRRGKRGADL